MFVDGQDRLGGIRRWRRARALARVSVTRSQLRSGVRSTGGGTAASPHASEQRRAQLSLEQSRGVIFLSLAYLAACSLTIGASIGSSAV